MNSDFYQFQAKAFRDYARRIPNKNLRLLFDQWAESKDMCETAKQEIWIIARKET